MKKRGAKITRGASIPYSDLVVIAAESHKDISSLDLVDLSQYIEIKEIKRPSALWVTEDDLFIIVKGIGGWMIRSRYLENDAFLSSLGLDLARFKTRREALENLEMALEGVA